MILIKDIMSPAPMSIESSVSIGDAKKIMSHHEIRHLPVVEQGELVGILTDRDIKLAQAVTDDLQFDSNCTVGDTCVHLPYTVQPDEPAHKVLAYMAEERIGSALVADIDELIGIFTVTDACRAFSTLLEKLDIES